MNVGSAFSGIGMLDYGLHLAGLKHAWLCESDPWRREILRQRFPGAVVLDDVRTLGAATAGPVTVLAGGFPCKGASTAGKRQGFGHPETVLWREMRRAISELRPRYVLVENVANLLALHDGAVWGEVLGDLAALGFDVVWDCLPAAAVGAPHRRDRVFAVATHADGAGRGQRGGTEPVGAQLAAAERGGPATPNAEGRDEGAVESPRRERAGRPGSQRGTEAASHAGGGGRAGEGRRRTLEPNQRAVGADDQGRDGQAPADADLSPADAHSSAGPPRGAVGKRVGATRGVDVEWGDFGPAIRRWESIQGPAPEPLVRRVDDGATRRVERSRLSALGDGVQCQVGFIAGRYIVDLERERVAA